MKYYSADFHLFHKNIIKYSNRPFADIDQMNRSIIDRINEVVGENDEFYILGDVAFAPVDRFRPLMLEINCRNVSLVPGNHDPAAVLAMTGNDGACFWKSVSPLMEVRDQGKHVVLCHYKMSVFNKSHHGAIQLFGHSHGSMPGNTQQVDVGVDCWGYRPVTLNECMERMLGLPSFKSDDHHA